MKRLLIFVILNLAFAILPAVPAAGQTTHNIDIIWQKAKPETTERWQGWGYRMASGDLNGDGYSDFVTALDSSTSDAPQRYMVKIYIFNGGSTISNTPSQVIIYDSIGDYPTPCIADFNGDGINDLALGDQRGTGTNSEKGQVLIHYGTGVDLNPTPDLVIGGYGSATATGFGYTVSAGDINGDSIADLIVDAPAYPISGDRNGRIYIYYGDTLGIDIWPDIILNGHSSPIYYENFGTGKSDGCDLNNDGYDDIIASGPVNSINGSASGKVYYYLSNNAPLDTIADGWIYGEGVEQNLGGFNLSIINNDTNGFNPTGWFGTPIWPNTAWSLGEGKCYMVPGDIIGETPPDWVVTGFDTHDTALGYWSSSAGYADNDKLGDFLTGTGAPFQQGKAYLFLRRSTMRLQPDGYIVGRSNMTSNGDVLGAMVAPAGDVDGDGKDEFMVSNYYADSSNMIWLCKYTGPDGVAGQPVNNEQLAINNVLQNSPNPFSQQTTIKYQVSQSGKVSLKVYNIAGQVVRVLANEEKKVGSYEVRWYGFDDNGQRISNGIYIYQLKTGGESMVKKMTLLR